jgi:hypothetical protein
MLREALVELLDQAGFEVVGRPPTAPTRSPWPSSWSPTSS